MSYYDAELPKRLDRKLSLNNWPLLLTQRAHDGLIPIQVSLNQFWRCQSHPLVQRAVHEVGAFDHFQEAQRRVTRIFDLTPVFIFVVQVKGAV
jgi:hypothetical protein